MKQVPGNRHRGERLEIGGKKLHKLGQLSP